jgi:hypothetical protein
MILKTDHTLKSSYCDACDQINTPYCFNVCVMKHEPGYPSPLPLDLGMQSRRDEHDTRRNDSD